MNEIYSQEVKFCVKYLLDHGINALNFQAVVNQVTPLDKKFDLVQVKKKDNFFDELAARLRELWPPGEKRDSVGNLSRRLEMLWKERGYTDKSIEQCLTVARRYLAKFEDNVKYMQTLKYFILKQENLIDKKTGKIKYINKSVFADMLESESELDKIDEEWGNILNGSTLDEGELI